MKEKTDFKDHLQTLRSIAIFRVILYLSVNKLSDVFVTKYLIVFTYADVIIFFMISGFLFSLFCWLKKCGTGVSNEKYEKESIVSITSFPPRMDTMRWTLEFIIRQSMKPNRIEIWLC